MAVLAARGGPAVSHCLPHITCVIAGSQHNLCYKVRSMSSSIECALSVRDRLVAAALTVLERDGLAAVQARTLAAEIGASTMAVYTHFGGMPTLIEAVVCEGFARFADHTRAAPQTNDPVADLVAGGLAYADFAMRNPRLYRVLFGLNEFDVTPQSSGAAVSNLSEGIDALSVLVVAVERVIAAGRIRPQEPRPVAAQLLSATHGFVLLLMTDIIETQGLEAVMAPLAINLLVGLGDTRRRAERSVTAALEAYASGKSHTSRQQ
jgi:AcrR family transcriptional regulator